MPSHAPRPQARLGLHAAEASPDMAWRGRLGTDPRADGPPELPSGLHQTVMAPGCMEGRRSQQRAARLPTDPVELRAAITREPRGERLSPEEDFSAVTRLLRTPEAPLELCRALYRVACALPGVVELGEVVDRAG